MARIDMHDMEIILMSTEQHEPTTPRHDQATSGEPEARPRPRNTRQRRLISEQLAARSEFRTAQQVHAELAETDETPSLATTYRVLASLAETGEADTWRTPDGELAYRHCSPGHHHHLICRNCGLTIEISGGPAEAWVASVASQHGFTQPDHRVEIFGLCSACSHTSTD